jgi:predicted porin
MQKKIIALAIAAAFASPVAMADVTVYGSLDGGFRHQTNDSPAQGTTDSMQLGQYNTSRFGLKSVEDMGDGMKANVVLEGSPTTPATPAQSNISGSTGTGTAFTNGVALFDRQATIGLSGGFGAVDMGWNYTTSFKVIKTYDPFDYKYLSIAGAKSSDVKRMTPAGTSANQDRTGNLTYTGKFGDVTVLAEYMANNSTKIAQPTAGTGRSVGAIYAGGPINVGVAYTKIEASLGGTDEVTHVTAGAGFNFGDGKVSVGYAKNAIATSGVSDNTETNMWAGASFNISSKIAVTGAYYKNTTNAFGSSVDATKNTVMAGVTYDLSKKTQVYFEMDRAVANAGGAAIDVTTVGSSLGLSTSF